MRERRRLVFDGIYLHHIAAARQYAREEMLFIGIHTLDLFEVQKTPEGTLNILVAREASSLQSVL